jgi:hypothetical protein
VAVAVFIVPFVIDWSIKAATHTAEWPPNPLLEIFWMVFGCSIGVVAFMLVVLAVTAAWQTWRPTCDFIVHGEVIANLVSAGVAILRRVWLAFSGRFFAVGDRPAPFAAVVFASKVAIFAVPFLPIALLAELRAQIVATAVVCIYILAPQRAERRPSTAA